MLYCHVVCCHALIRYVYVCDIIARSRCCVVVCRGVVV